MNKLTKQLFNIKESHKDESIMSTVMFHGTKVNFHTKANQLVESEIFYLQFYLLAHINFKS